MGKIDGSSFIIFNKDKYLKIHKILNNFFTEFSIILKFDVRVWDDFIFQLKYILIINIVV